MKKKLLAGLVTGLFMFGVATSVHAATFNFSGTITNVLTDSGSGTYSGTAVGDSFSGIFLYGDNAAQASDINTEPNERDWEFEGGAFSASITDGVTPTNFSLVNINIQNDWPLGTDTVNFLNTLFGQNVSVGTRIDTWASGGITDGTYWIDAPTPEDPDNENLANGMNVEVSFVSYDTTLYSSLDYQPLHPGTADLALFWIEEADAAGNTLYSAVGLLDTNPVLLSNYLAVGDAGDSWTYTVLDPSGTNDFTVNLTSTNDGVLRIGDFVYDISEGHHYSVWSTYDLVEDTIRLHSDFNPFYGLSIYDPPIELPTTVETNQLLTSPLPLTLFGADYLLFEDSITVQAGTFNNILVAIELDDDGIPNNYNSSLGLDITEVPYAVSAISWYAKGIGLVKALDVDSDEEDVIADIEFDYELTSTTIDIGNNVSDTDGDEIPDKSDNCPNTSNPSQSDSDNDGIGDACDSFTDSDNDGIRDSADKCPDYDDHLDADADGIPNCIDFDDTDGDGLTDAKEVLCGSDPADSGSKCSKGMSWLLLLLDN
ncbi:MAG: thrombospondin type 3 repeat-containing protein [Thermodesulfobacteriota bacterium]|nr:thrombospondin type 3 repeat-containing protein [Thermodesulfobacteriota bacterium]